MVLWNRFLSSNGKILEEMGKTWGRFDENYFLEQQLVNRLAFN